MKDKIAPESSGSSPPALIQSWSRDEFLVSDDRQKIDVQVVMSLLASSYWAHDRSPDVMRKAMENSVCFGLYHTSGMIGFGRAVTDHVTFAWIADVIVDSKWRGRGLGRWLVECILAHPSVKTRTQALATLDAHSLYERYGFARHEYMRRGPPINLPR